MEDKMINKEAYQIREITPKEMQCGIAACPTIYQIEECIGGACPGVHSDSGDYLIIGKLVEPNKARLPDGISLEGKVGKNEALVRVPRELIDKMQREQV